MPITEVFIITEKYIYLEMDQYTVGQTHMKPNVVTWTGLANMVTSKQASH